MMVQYIWHCTSNKYILVAGSVPGHSAVTQQSYASYTHVDLFTKYYKLIQTKDSNSEPRKATNCIPDRK